MEDESRVPTNLRMLLIMEAVSSSVEPLSPTEINRLVGLPKQSIHRLCQTLIEEGFLIRDVSGKRLRPSPRSLKMAQGLITSRQATIARHQILVELAATVRETVNFAVPEPDGMTYLDRVETDWPFRIELPIGSRVPFYATASGKCFLSSLASREREKILSAIPFEELTANTHKNASSLSTELKAIRKQSYALDMEELFDGMVALAVPVRDRQGRFLAAVAFHGPTQRLGQEDLLRHLETMQEGAKRLAALAG